jgi:hypothetical protein
VRRSCLPRPGHLESLLTPQKEIAPQYATWIIETSGGLRTGTIVGEDADGAIRLASGDGAVERIGREAIELRRMTEGSLMPEGLGGAGYAGGDAESAGVSGGSAVIRNTLARPRPRERERVREREKGRNHRPLCISVMRL